MDDVESIGERLCRMVDVALKVYQGRLLLELVVLGRLCHGIYELVHVGVALTDVHVITDAYDVRHEGDHGSCLADRLAVCDLRLFLVEVCYLKSEQVACAGIRESGTCRIVPEDRDTESGIEDFCGLVAFSEISQRVCYGEYRFDLII